MIRNAFLSIVAAAGLAIGDVRSAAAGNGFFFQSAPVCVNGSCFSGRQIVVQDSPIILQRSAPVVFQQSPPVIVQEAAPVIIQQRALRIRRGLFGRLIIR